MRNKRYWSAISIVLAMALSAASAQTPGATPRAPALSGTAITGILEYGEGYTSHRT